MPILPPPRRPIKKLNAQTGTAIFLALLILTLITALTVIWTMQNRVSVRRTQQILISNQALQHSQGVVDWAISFLRNLPPPTTNTPPPIWPKQLPATALENFPGKIKGQIDDYQARININALSDPTTKQTFVKLLGLLDKTISEQVATQIANKIIAATSSSINNPSMPTNTNQPPMLSISELRLIPEISAHLFELMSPYIAALPPKIPSNFSNAQPLLLQAANQTQSGNQISDYYLVRADVMMSDYDITVYTLLYRKNIDNKIQVGVVWQSFGTV